MSTWDCSEAAAESMALMRCYCTKEATRKKRNAELDAQTSARGSDVRVVLAGGIVEVYVGPIPAFVVMRKHPGLILARPEVFKRPRESLMGPRERLFPGQKFYMVPHSTVKKLLRAMEVAEAEEEEEEEEQEEEEEPVFSAKDFYTSRERWIESSMRKLGEGSKKQLKEQQQQQQGRQLTCCNNKVRMMKHGLLHGWKPSLPSIQEISP